MHRNAQCSPLQLWEYPDEFFSKSLLVNKKVPSTYFHAKYAELQKLPGDGEIRSNFHKRFYVGS